MGFENLYPEDFPYYAPRHELFQDGKKWRYKTSSEAVRTPNGQYNFVVQEGKIYIGRQQFNGIGSHIYIARGQNVDFADRIRFGHNSSNIAILNQAIARKSEFSTGIVSYYRQMQRSLLGSIKVADSYA